MICNYVWALLHEILGSHKINTMWFMTLESPKEPIRRKALDPGKFRPRVRARAVWEYARLRQLCRSAYVCVREQSCRKLPFCPVLLSVPRKNMKQRASKHCFHTEGRGSQANFWISWETNASERFLPIMSSPSMVVINLFGMKWVVLSQRVTASPGNLLLHLQLCLCPRLDAGKLLVAPWTSVIALDHFTGLAQSSPLTVYCSSLLKYPHSMCMVMSWAPPCCPCMAAAFTTQAHAVPWQNAGVPRQYHCQHAVSIAFGWGHQ